MLVEAELVLVDAELVLVDAELVLVDAELVLEAPDVPPAPPAGLAPVPVTMVVVQAVPWIRPRTATALERRKRR